MDDFKYDTAQDKLLIMLLERIGTLEDEVKKNTENIERLITATTSRCFGINMSGKYIEEAKAYESVKDHMESIKSVILSTFPETKMYINYYHNNESAHLVIETKHNWLLESVQFKLDEKIRDFVNLNSWTMRHYGIPHHYKVV